MRNPIYDNIKGIGILLVVLGHVWIAPDLIKKTIYAFHMPMFFILSGYLFNEEKKRLLGTKEFIFSRIKRLYLPALFIGFSCAIPSIALGQTKSLSEFAQRSLGVIFSIPNADLTFNSSPVWFLSCLLCVEIYFFLLVKFTKSQLWITVLCLFSLGVFLSREFQFFSPLNSHVALSGLFFFFLGNRMRKIDFIGSHKPKALYLVTALLLLVGTTFLNPIKIGMASNRLGDLNYLILGALSGSYVVWYLSKLLGENKLLGIFGRNTILILGYNYWAYILVDKSLKTAHIPYNWAINFACQVLLFLIASLIVNKVPTLNLLIQGTTPSQKTDGAKNAR